jgi:hypothetical protein
VPFEYLKQLLKLQTSLFFDALIAENEFEWPFDTLKHHLSKFTKVFFWDTKKADYEF